MSDKRGPAGDGEILIYPVDDGGAIRVLLEGETVWLTQAQIAELFQTTPQNVTQHLKAIYGEGELQESATCKDYLQVRQEGKREVAQRGPDQPQRCPGVGTEPARRLRRALPPRGRDRGRRPLRRGLEGVGEIAGDRAEARGEEGRAQRQKREGEEMNRMDVEIPISRQAHVYKLPCSLDKTGTNTAKLDGEVAGLLNRCVS